MYGTLKLLPLFALSLMSSAALADPTSVEVVVPNYEIIFSKLPEGIDILGLRPGMDEATAIKILTDAGYKFEAKNSGKDCSYPETQFERFQFCIEKDDGPRSFVSANPIESLYLHFAPVQAGGGLLEIARYVDYRKATSSAEIPKPEEVVAALKAKYPPPTAGNAYDLEYEQCWAYRYGEPVTRFGFGAWCDASEGNPVDVRLTFSNSFRMEANLLDINAKEQAYSKYRAYVKAASEKIIQESLSKSAGQPKL